jgi:Glycosyl hydrolase family 9
MQVVAGMAAGALALRRYDALAVGEVEATLRDAHRLLTSVMLTPSAYTSNANVTDEPIAQMYPSNSYIDDLFWASTWLLRATQAPDHFRPGNASYYYAATRTTFELTFAERDSMAVSPDYMNNVALIHAASITKARTVLPHLLHRAC